MIQTYAKTARRALAPLLALLPLALLACGGPTGSEDNPELLVTPLVLDYGETNTSQFLTVTNSGTGVLNFTIEVPNEGWITVSQRQGSITNQPLAVDVRIDREKAPVGQQDIKLVVTGPNAARVEVTLRATIRRVARLSLSPTTLDFGEAASRQQVTLRNEGGEALDWGAASSQGWISAEPASGSLQPGDQQAVTVVIDREGQAPGSIQGSMDFTSDGGSASVIVQATVPNLPLPSVSPTTLDFGTVQTRLSTELRNIGAGVLDWSLEVSDAWIRPATTSGAVLVGEARRVFVEVDRAGLEPGAYQGTATFRSVGGDVAVEIFLRVSEEPVLELSETALDAADEETFTFSVINAGSGNLLWDLTETEDWLELDPISGTTASVPQTVTGRIAREGLEAGSYGANIRVESDGGTGNLELGMRVPLPQAEITAGPEEGAVLGDDAFTFEYRARQAYGLTEFSTRLDGGQWSEWSTGTSVSYRDVEESSLAGEHRFEVRTRADAGESEPTLRRFSVDAVGGPALRLTPKAPAGEAGDTVVLEIVAEEVGPVLAARLVLDFDADVLELQQVSPGEDFWTQRGGTVVQPQAEIDNASGRLDLSVGVAGGSAAGVEGTGALARLTFRAKRSGGASVSFAAGTALRDPLNAEVAVGTLGATVEVR